MDRARQIRRTPARTAVAVLTVVVAAAVSFGLRYAARQGEHGIDQVVKSGATRECARNTGTDQAPDIWVLSCSDPGATYRVLYVAPGSDAKQCDGLLDVTRAFVGRSSHGGDGHFVVYCVAPNR